VTSGWVTSGHQRSRDVISCHATAYCELQLCRKWKLQYTRVFGLQQPLPGDFQSNDIASASLPVTWGHVTSFPVTLLAFTASYSIVKSEMCRIREFTAFCSHFQKTSGQVTLLPVHLRSRDVISCDVTTSYCELQLCRKRYVQYMQVFGFLQPLPGDFR